MLNFGLLQAGAPPGAVTVITASGTSGILTVNDASGPGITIIKGSGIESVVRSNNNIWINAAASGADGSLFLTNTQVSTSGYVKQSDLLASGYIRNVDFLTSGYVKTLNGLKDTVSVVGSGTLNVWVDGQTIQIANGLLTVAPKTANYTVLTADSSKVFTNEGSNTTLFSFFLPLNPSGSEFTFIVDNSSGIRIQANSGQTIQMGSFVTISSGYAESQVVGSATTLVAINNTRFYAKSLCGSWSGV